MGCFGVPRSRGVQVGVDFAVDTTGSSRLVSIRREVTGFLGVS